jgi:hypothetical protein
MADSYELDAHPERARVCLYYLCGVCSRFPQYTIFNFKDHFLIKVLKICDKSFLKAESSVIFLCHIAASHLEIRNVCHNKTWQKATSYMQGL